MICEGLSVIGVLMDAILLRADGCRLQIECAIKFALAPEPSTLDILLVNGCASQQRSQ